MLVAKGMLGRKTRKQTSSSLRGEFGTGKKSVKVIFIAGCSRSGSTLLGKMLGNIDGFFHVGEFGHLWKKSFDKNWMCECGQAFSGCPFWTDVITSVFEGNEVPHVKRIRSMQTAARRALRKSRPLRFLLARPRHQTVLRDYACILTCLLAEIRRVTSARVIVDSSKNPLDGLLISMAENVEVHTIHLIRDSRAVAHSLQRDRIYPGPAGASVYMQKSGPVRSSRVWRRENARASWLRRDSSTYLQLKYEDFVQDPRRHLLEITQSVGENAPDLKFLSGHLADLKCGHSLAGNPMRFKKGKLNIRLDDEWQRKMPRRDRYIVTALTADLLHRFGYFSQGCKELRP